MRARVRLRRSLRRVDESIGRISAAVEDELNELREQQKITRPSINSVRNQLAQAMSRNGSIDQLIPSGSQAASEAGSEAWLRPTAASDMRLPGRRFAIVTTAALPWMTGTSINPLLRAASLASKGYEVSLVLPWLLPAQQPTLFPAGVTFDEPAEQEVWIREWLRRGSVADAASLERLTVRWYPGVYEEFLGAVIQRSRVDLTSVVPAAERDVAILEEPEHINWYHTGEQWTRAFAHVVGVLHTNYLYYAKYEEREGGAGDIPPVVREQIMSSLNNLVCRAHVDVSIKLSSTLPDVPGRCVVCNVHGVRGSFLAIGQSMAALGTDEAAKAAAFDGGAYFLGKALWTKGYRALLDEMEMVKARGEEVSGVGGGAMSAGEGSGDAELPTIDTYGSGRDEAEIREAIEAAAVPIVMHPAIDHANPALHGYRVFVNPSTSEVLCTATAEALAMGKKVLIPRHPSNLFFEQFSNVLMYEERSELAALLREALATPPLPMSPKEQYLLSWEAATERLLDAALLPAAVAPRGRPEPALAYAVHASLGAPLLDDYFRANSGATPQYATWQERVAALARGTYDEGGASERLLG